MYKTVRTLLWTFILSTLPLAVHASTGGGHDYYPDAMRLAGIVLAAHLVGRVLQKIGQAPVIGYLILGMVAAKLPGAKDFGQSAIIGFPAFLGSCCLLLEAGLENSPEQMKRSGKPSMKTALIGVIVPGVLTTLCVKIFWPTTPWMVAIFYGATMTATSVGITLLTLKSIDASHWLSAKINLGAAVIDDIIGVTILSVIDSVLKKGAVDPGAILVSVLLATAFVGASLFFGRTCADVVSKTMCWLFPASIGKLLFVILFCGAFIGIAKVLGLAEIIGAFAAGLVLDKVHFKDFQGEHDIEDLIHPISQTLIPIFFVGVGLQIDLAVFARVELWGKILTVTTLAAAGKIVAGWGAGQHLSLRGKLALGVGMVARGEVGIVFIQLGSLAQLGSRPLLTPEDSAVLMAAVILTTLVTPPALKAVYNGYREPMDDEADSSFPKAPELALKPTV